MLLTTLATVSLAGIVCGWWLRGLHDRRTLAKRAHAALHAPAVLYWKHQASAYQPDDDSEPAREARMMVTATRFFPTLRAT